MHQWSCRGVMTTVPLRNKQTSHTQSIRAYAYDNTRIRVCQYAYTRMTIRVYACTYTRRGSSLLFTSNCFFCEVLLDKTITSFVRKTQKARAVRLQPNLHIVKTSLLSGRRDSSLLTKPSWEVLSSLWAVSNSSTTA